MGHLVWDLRPLSPTSTHKQTSSDHTYVSDTLAAEDVDEGVGVRVLEELLLAVGGGVGVERGTSVTGLDAVGEKRGTSVAGLDAVREKRDTSVTGLDAVGVG